MACVLQTPRARENKAESPVNSLTLQDLDVSEVCGLLKRWNLDNAFGKCFREMQADGIFVSLLEPGNEPLHFCPKAATIHWQKFHKMLQQWKVNPHLPERENEDGTQTTNGFDRRQLSSVSPTTSGLSIKSDMASIRLGSQGDIELMRSGSETVTLSGNLNVTGMLTLAGYGRFTRCADVNAATLGAGSYNGTRSVSDGEYVDLASVTCNRGYYVDPTQRWRCVQNGGIAILSEEVCKPYQCDDVTTGVYQLHGGLYSGNQEVRTGEYLTATGAINNCSGSYGAVDFDGVSTHYIPHVNATWICPEQGGTAYPSEQLCTCSAAVCSDWTLLLEDASYGGTWDTEYPSRATGSFSQLIAVWKSGYVSCDSNYDASGSSSYPWQACGVSHSGCSGTDYSWEFKINDDYIVSQSKWCQLSSACETPDTPSGDIYCTVDFEINEGDVCIHFHASDTNIACYKLKFAHNICVNLVAITDFDSNLVRGIASNKHGKQCWHDLC